MEISEVDHNEMTGEIDGELTGKWDDEHYPSQDVVDDGSVQVDPIEDYPSSSEGVDDEGQKGRSELVDDEATEDYSGQDVVDESLVQDEVDNGSVQEDSIEGDPGSSEEVDDEGQKGRNELVDVEATEDYLGPGQEVVEGKEGPIEDFPGSGEEVDDKGQNELVDEDPTEVEEGSGQEVEEGLGQEDMIEGYPGWGEEVDDESQKGRNELTDETTEDYPGQGQEVDEGSSQEDPIEDYPGSVEEVEDEGQKGRNELVDDEATKDYLGPGQEVVEGKEDPIEDFPGLCEEVDDKGQNELVDEDPTEVEVGSGQEVEEGLGHEDMIEDYPGWDEEVDDESQKGRNELADETTEDYPGQGQEVDAGSSQVDPIEDYPGSGEEVDDKGQNELVDEDPTEVEVGLGQEVEEGLGQEDMIEDYPGWGEEVDDESQKGRNELADDTTEDYPGQGQEVDEGSSQEDPIEDYPGSVEEVEDEGQKGRNELVDDEATEDYSGPGQEVVDEGSSQEDPIEDSPGSVEEVEDKGEKGRNELVDNDETKDYLGPGQEVVEEGSGQEDPIEDYPRSGQELVDADPAQEVIDEAQNDGEGSNELVDKDPTVKWDEDYPPLPSSQKVNHNIVASSRIVNSINVSRQEFPNTKNIESVEEPFSILMKVPRLDDASIQEQINLAKLQLEEKTRLRDSIQVQIQDKRDNSHIHRLNYESAKDEGYKAKALVKSKVKQLHEESTSDLGSEDDYHLKIIRKELQILKEIIITAAEAANEAEKKCDAENVKIKQLQVKSRAANDARQAAYVHLQSLKTKLSAKNQHFFRYKDDAAFANNHKRNGNKTALHCLCTDQVERLMKLWNTNDDFRLDYVRSNTRSTIQRLGTFDGRSLGPGEKPPALSNYGHGRVDLAPKISTIVKEHENRKVTIRIPALNEAELTKKAEKMLKEEEETEAKLKEQQRMEELAKAEMASKKKLRRLRKKEKKKEKKKANAVVGVAAMDVDNDVSNSETAAAEMSKGDESTVVPKMAEKFWLLTKALSILPAVLCSRPKRSHRQLVWIYLISLFLYSILAREC